METVAQSPVAENATPAESEDAAPVVDPTQWYVTPEDLAILPPDDPAREFAADVAAQPHQHNRWVHLAVRRHLLDLTSAQNDDSYPYTYHPRRALKAIHFAPQFRSVEGPLSGQRIRLMPWQCFVVAMVWGWRKREDPRRRRFKYAYTTVPKKNGKTPFAALIGLYQTAHPPPHARCDVYSVATKKDTAKIVWKDGKRMLTTNPKWSRQFRPLHSELIHGPTDSIWTPVGSDSDKQEGLRPELVIMDELHAWPKRDLWDIFNDAFGVAFSPLIFQITTAGNNPDGICMEQEQRVRRVLDAIAAGSYEGRSGDEAFYFGCIWTFDQGDKWDDEDTWHKANPSLGRVKSLEEMRALAVGAQNSLGSRRTFRIKQLNEWQETGAEKWLAPEQWGDCHRGKRLTFTQSWERLRGCHVWGAIDFALTNDTNSLCMLANDPHDPEAVLAAWRYWLPGEDIAKRCVNDDQPYDTWSREGWLTLTNGTVSDTNKMEADIVKLISDYDLDVGQIGYDPNYSQGAGVRLMNDHGLPMVICPQSYNFYTKPINLMERLIQLAKFGHGGNPIAIAQGNACVLQEGNTGGKLLAKGKSTGRIDGMVAAAMAMGVREDEIENGANVPGLYVG